MADVKLRELVTDLQCNNNKLVVIQGGSRETDCWQQFVKFWNKQIS